MFKIPAIDKIKLISFGREAEEIRKREFFTFLVGNFERDIINKIITETDKEERERLIYRRFGFVDFINEFDLLAKQGKILEERKNES